MKALLAVVLGASATMCQPPPIVPDRAPMSAGDAVAAWSDAYNADAIEHLRTLVHPERHDAFDAERTALSARLEAWQVISYGVGDMVQVDGRLPGRLIKLKITDGRRQELREGVLVETEGRWWIWQF